jgi:hypothetical protein
MSVNLLDGRSLLMTSTLMTGLVRRQEQGLLGSAQTAWPL